MELPTQKKLNKWNYLLRALCLVLEYKKRNSTATQNIQTNAHCQRFVNNPTNLGSVHMSAVIFVS